MKLTNDEITQALGKDCIMVTQIMKELYTNPEVNTSEELCNHFGITHLECERLMEKAFTLGLLSRTQET